MATREVRFRKSFRLRDDQDEYTFQLRRRRNWWWLLLLLLPLLLFINCSHDVVVTVVDDDGNPVEQVGVDMSYCSHWLLNTDRRPSWLAKCDTVQHQVTDSLGRAVFSGVGTSVFSYLFYGTSQAKFTFGELECVAIKENPLLKNLHFTREVKVSAVKRRTAVRLQVVDAEDGAPIAEADVTVSWPEGKQHRTAKGKSDPNGMVTIDKVWTCATIDTIKASAYAYNDTVVTAKPVKVLLAQPDQGVIPLSPLKESFTFFVKDSLSRQPIPGAECKVTVSHSRSTKSGTAMTNVDGKGRGEYKDAPITAVISVDPVTAPHYKPGRLNLPEAQRMVEQFIKLPDSLRTIWLEPEPQTVQWQNVDSLNVKNGIKGVTNRIKITDPGGKVTQDSVMSNANGYFAVQAVLGSKIEVVSECEPGYEPKTTVVAQFDGKGQVIKLKPRMVDLTFRTVDADDPSTLVPGCTLDIAGSISGNLQPTDSGNGEFTVKNVRVVETISINAQKQGWKGNNTTINNTKVSYLADPSTPASARDIPLQLPGCDAGPISNEDNQSGTDFYAREFNMGCNSGTCNFSYHTHEAPDEIIIFDCPPADLQLPYNSPANKSKIVFHTKDANGNDGPVATGNGVYVNGSFQFTSRYVTVVGIGSSIWNVRIDCNGIKCN